MEMDVNINLKENKSHWDKQELKRGIKETPLIIFSQWYLTFFVCLMCHIKSQDKTHTDTYKFPTVHVSFKQTQIAEHKKTQSLSYLLGPFVSLSCFDVTFFPYTKQVLKINICYSLMWRNLAPTIQHLRDELETFTPSPTWSPVIIVRPHQCSCDWMGTNPCSQVPKLCKDWNQKRGSHSSQRTCSTITYHTLLANQYRGPCGARDSLLDLNTQKYNNQEPDLTGINVTLCAEIFFFCKLSCLLYIFTAVWQPYLKNVRVLANICILFFTP